MISGNMATNKLIENLDRACTRTGFVDIYNSQINAALAKTFYKTNRKFIIPSTDSIHVPQTELQNLAFELSQLLGVYTSPSTGSVGNGLYHLMGSAASPRLPSIKDYAKILVLAASRIGSKRVTKLLTCWIQGEPIRLHYCALLKGIKTEEEFCPVNCMRLVTLPTNANDFPPSLRIDVHDLLHERYGGRAMLAVELETERAFYDTETFVREFPPKPPRRELVNSALESISFDSFCRAMSLAADNHVDWFIQWDDYGDLEAFFLGHGFGCGRKEVPNTSAAMVSEPVLRNCMDIHRQLESFNGLDLAIARWRRSKQSTAMHEQLVELRIALESIFLSDDLGSSEKSYRLAMRGAWFLGTTYDERELYFRTLRNLYNYASKVIHAGIPKDKDSAPLTKTISDAQGLCRQAILQIAQSGSAPDWTKIVLNCSSD